MDEDVYIVDLYITPNYQGLNPVEVMPTWFHHMLHGPTADFHTLREAVAGLDDWAALAEVERFRRYEDSLRNV